MPEFMRHIIDLMEARPLTSAGVAIAAIMYMNFMLSGPRLR